MADKNKYHQDMKYYLNLGIQYELGKQFLEARRSYKKAYKIANKYNFVFYLPTIADYLNKIDVKIERGEYENPIEQLKPITARSKSPPYQKIDKVLIEKRKKLEFYELEEFEKIDFIDLCIQPEDLLKNLNRKTRKILNITPEELRNDSNENLEKYLEIFYADRHNFYPDRADHEIFVIEIEKRIRYIETIKKIRKENWRRRIINSAIIKPMKEGIFDDILNYYSRTKDSKGAARKAYSRFPEETLHELNISLDFYTEEFIKKLEERFK